MGEPVETAVVYPDSDGEPMADNTLQFEWIVVLKENIDALVPDFVAGDLLWYPVEGDPRTRVAPDVLVAFGRPKGHRGSYMQWREDGVAPQVVFEVLSPGNTAAEMVRKLGFYQRHGVDEYYVIDPDADTVQIHVRRDGHLTLVDDVEGFRSPRLGIRFGLGEHLEVRGPDGAAFRRFRELRDELAVAEARANEERARANEERDRADEERDRADALARELAQLRARLDASEPD